MNPNELTYTHAIEVLKALQVKLSGADEFKYSYLNAYMAILNKCERLAARETADQALDMSAAEFATPHTPTITVDGEVISQLSSKE